MFIKVKGYPAFLTIEKEQLLYNNSCKELSISESQKFNLKIRSSINKTENRKKDRIVNKIWRNVERKLIIQLEENPELFFSEYVEFDFFGEKAISIEIVNLLLYDYCNYYGHSFIQGISSEESNEFIGYDWPYFFPKETTIMISHVSNVSLFRRLKYRMRKRIISTVINTKKVNRIKGNLSSFYIDYDNDSRIYCGEHFKVEFSKVGES